MQLQGFKCIKHKGGIEGATEVFCKKDELNIFTKFTGKHLGQSFRPATLLKERLWRRCFPVNYVNFLRTPLYTEHLRTTAFGGMKKFFCFSLSKKITDIWKQPLRAALQKRCSEVCFRLRKWGVLDNTKSGHTDKIRCSVKILPSCVGCWCVLDYNVEDKLEATW